MQFNEILRVSNWKEMNNVVSLRAIGGEALRFWILRSECDHRAIANVAQNISHPFVFNQRAIEDRTLIAQSNGCRTFA